MSPVTDHFALDTMIFDRLAGDSLAPGTIQQLVDAHRIELVVTIVQEEELAAIPVDKQAKRALIAGIPRVVLPGTSGIVGEAVIGSMRLDTTGRINRPPGHDNDSSIAGEALARDYPLVTEDSKLANAATKQGVRVWDFSRFVAHIQSL